MPTPPIRNLNDLINALSAESDYDRKKKLFYDNQKIIAASKPTLTQVGQLYTELPTQDKTNKLQKLIPWKDVTIPPQEAPSTTLKIDHYAFELILSNLIDPGPLMTLPLEELSVFLKQVPRYKLKDVTERLIQSGRLRSLDQLTAIMSGLEDDQKDYVAWAVKNHSVYISIPSLQSYLSFLKNVREVTILPHFIDQLLESGTITRMDDLTSIMHTLNEMQSKALISCDADQKEVLLNATDDERDELIRAFKDQRQSLIDTYTYLKDEVVQAIMGKIDQPNSEPLQHWASLLNECPPSSVKKLTIQLINQGVLHNLDEFMNFIKMLNKDTKEDVFVSAQVLANYPSCTIGWVKQSDRLVKIQLAMGLKQLAPEGESLDQANLFAKQRFSTLAPKIEPRSEQPSTLPFHPVAQFSTANDLIAPLQTHGDFQGIHAQWEDHAFSFHLINDGEKTHLIYVNRGQRHELAAYGDPKVLVFTLNDQKTLQEVTTELLDALKTARRSTISKFIHDRLMPFKNTTLSEKITKSHQKVGNCTVANANIAWHFELASRLMKRQPELSFSEAYAQTKPLYKTMRMEDRATIFCDLITQPLESKETQAIAIREIMKKMVQKDLSTPGRESVRFLLSRLHERDPTAVKKQFNELCQSLPSDNAYTNYTNATWASAMLKILIEQQQCTNEEIIAMTEQISAMEARIDKQALCASLSTQTCIKLVQSNPQYMNALQSLVKDIKPNNLDDYTPILKAVPQITPYLSDDVVKKILLESPENTEGIIPLLSQIQLKSFAQKISVKDFDEHWPIIKMMPQLIPHLPILSLEKMLMKPKSDVVLNLIQAMTLEQLKELADKINATQANLKNALLLIEKLPQMIPLLSSDVIIKVLQEAPDSAAAKVCVEQVSEEQVRQIAKEECFDITPIKVLFEKYPQTIADADYSIIASLLTAPDVKPDIQQAWIKSLSAEQLKPLIYGPSYPQIASSIFFHAPELINDAHATRWLKDALKHDNEYQIQNAITILDKRPDLIKETPETVLESILKQENAPDSLKQLITNHQKNTVMEQQQAQKTSDPPPITAHTESTTAATAPTADYRHAMEALREKENIPTQSPHPLAAMPDTVSLGPVESTTRTTACEERPKEEQDDISDIIIGYDKKTHPPVNSVDGQPPDPSTIKQVISKTS
ncbi:MAG: hypothetical protein NTW08_01525 [Gammaproteobacteria bacterium]|nr:hypothetical protein [Gammaproteobacteria bacterium]